MPEHRSVLRASIVVAGLALGSLAAPGAAVDVVTWSFDLPTGNPALRYLSGDIPGLVTVDLGFLNGDHHIKDFAAVPHDGTGPSTDFLVHMSDVDGGDRVSGTIRWADFWNYSSSPRVVVGTNCAGSCRLPIPRLARQQQTFVLAGFSFRNTEPATDRHLREVAVLPAPYEGFVDVVFRDDSGTRPFRVDIRYLVLPYGMARGEVTRQGSSSGGSSLVSRPAGKAALQGFRLQFTNSDHHLERFAVDLHADRIRTIWRDGDANDPYTWWVSYATLED